MSTIMAPSDYVLEAVNLYYTGHVEPVTWVKQVTGTVRSGMILRDVNFEVHCGEIMAILGSKGSGKKALLDVIATRANGAKKGYVLLNGVNINRRLFHEAGAYFSGMNDKYLQTGVTVHQALYYQACLTLNVPSGVRKARIRQILSDIALTQVGGKNVDKLTPSEKRRLAIGIQLIKDPILLLADEPAWNLDPLNTYFIVSILSNYATKYGRIVVLTMEKPRSDIFPFLNRVTYLCLGDVVYSGNTRLMLDYFRAIGFPCPEVENPLMYYLCLATVDRRSHEKFIESNNKIGVLVDKFKVEGSQFRKGGLGPVEGRGSVPPLHGRGKPSAVSKLTTLVSRNLSTSFMFNWKGAQQLFFRLLFFPLMFFIAWIFYFGKMSPPHQHSYVTQNGLALTTLGITYFCAIWSTVMTFDSHRKRYYQEVREGLYAGPTFIFSYSLSSLFTNVITCLIASRIIFEASESDTATNWILSFLVILTCYLMAQQYTLGTMILVKNRLISTAMLMAFHGITIAWASGTVKSLRTLPEWLYYVTYVMQPRYAGTFFVTQSIDEFGSAPVLQNNVSLACSGDSLLSGCRYLDNKVFYRERYFVSSDGSEDLNMWLNFGLCFVFPAVAFFFNLIVYTLPLPAILKDKFRE